MLYNAPAGQDSFMEGELVPVGNGYYRYSYVQYVEVLPIAGDYGDNDTGVSLGGFQISDSAYLIAGNTTSQGEDYDPYGQRNIFITVTPKDAFTQEATTVRYLTNYAANDQVVLSNPHFVEVGQNKYAVIWTENDGSNETMCYTFVDGEGIPTTEIYRASGVYYLDFDQIKATQFGLAITASFLENGEQTDKALEHSVYSYVAMNLGAGNAALTNLLKAIYNYDESAQRV